MSEYRLFHGDCLDILPALEDASIDAIIADIPSGRTACAWDSVIPFDSMWAQLRRIIRPKCAIVLLGCTQPFTSALVISNAPWFRHHWIWQKTKATNYVKARQMPMRYHEDICVFSSAGVRYYPQMRAGKEWTRIYHYRNKADAIIQDTRTAGTQSSGAGRFPSSVLLFAGDGGDLHPTQKPLALLEYLIKTYTNAGETVLDFCYGSGTTGHACANLERSFVGIEKDAGYYASGAQRIATAYAPLRAMQEARG
jgi:site-specific DNA-methyltransferase (adenine-specific)